MLPGRGRVGVVHRALVFDSIAESIDRCYEGSLGSDQIERSRVWIVFWGRGGHSRRGRCGLVGYVEVVDYVSYGLSGIPNRHVQ